MDQFIWKHLNMKKEKVILKKLSKFARKACISM